MAEKNFFHSFLKKRISRLIDDFVSQRLELCETHRQTDRQQAYLAACENESGSQGISAAHTTGGAHRGNNNNSTRIENQNLSANKNKNKNKERSELRTAAVDE